MMGKQNWVSTLGGLYQRTEPPPVAWTSPLTKNRTLSAVAEVCTPAYLVEPVDEGDVEEVAVLQGSTLLQGSCVTETAVITQRQ